MTPNKTGSVGGKDAPEGGGHRKQRKRLDSSVSSAQNKMPAICNQTNNLSGSNSNGGNSGKNASSDDEDKGQIWTPKHLGDLRAYNRSASEVPAEVSVFFNNLSINAYILIALSISKGQVFYCKYLI